MNETALSVLQSTGWQCLYQSRNPKSAHVGPCPVGQHDHDAHSPRFSLSQDGQSFYCFKCGFAGVGAAQMRKALEEAGGYVPPTDDYGKPPPRKGKERKLEIDGCTLAELAVEKGLDINYLEFLGWHDTTYLGKPAVAMPYWDQNFESVLATKYRVNLHGKLKTLWPKGTTPVPFGLHALRQARDSGEICIVEGETDAALLDQEGIPAIGLPGVHSWKPEWTVYLSGIKCNYIWQESGGKPNKDTLTPGQEFVHRVATNLQDDHTKEVYFIPAPPEGKDPVEVAQFWGSAFVDRMAQLREQAERYPYPVKEKPEWNVPPGGKGTKRPFTARRDIQIWDRARELFPRPSGYASVYTGTLYSQSKQAAVLVTMYKDTWQNPVNASFKRQKMYINLMRRIGAQPVYFMQLPLDDWSSKKHAALGKRIKRAGAEWVGIDNFIHRGYYTYFVIGELNGFERVIDTEASLVDALRAIEPPSPDEDGVKHRVYTGSDGLTYKLMETGERPRGEWQLVGKMDGSPNYTVVEAEIIARNLEYHEEPRRYWQGEEGHKLVIEVDGWEDARDLCLAWGMKLCGAFAYTMP